MADQWKEYFYCESIVWHTEDGELSEKHSGRNAAALESLVLCIAEEAYSASLFEDCR